MNTTHLQAKAGAAKAKPQVIKLGLDLHARQVTECRQLDGSTPKPARAMGPREVVGSSRGVGPGRHPSLQLLRGGRLWLLVSPRTGQAGRGQLCGSATALGQSTQQTSENRSAGCAGAVRPLGELSTGEPPGDEPCGGA